MRSLLVELFGVYSPVRDTAGNVVSGMAGVDWVWVLGVLTFIVILSSVFRLIGILLRGR